MATTFRTLKKLLTRSLSGQRVLVRVDLNLPVDASGQVGHAESFRVEACLETIVKLADANAVVLVMSHRGRPAGRMRQEDSLAPFVPVLSEALHRPVVFVSDPFSAEQRAKIFAAAPGSIFLMENLRFYPGEDDNDIRFARELAKLGVAYVNEAFAVSHRAAASVVGLPKILPCYAGCTFESEIKHLRKVMQRPRKPLVAILGGAKISTKIGVIKRLSRIADSVFLVGGLANAYLEASGLSIGQSLSDPESVEVAKKLLRNKKIMIPVDFRVVKARGKTPLPGRIDERLPNDIRRDEWIGDIGSETERLLAHEIEQAGSIIWNGPAGYFEDYRFRGGTTSIVESLRETNAEFVIGGGETVQAWRQADPKIVMKKGFVSTGGGAMLEFLEGKTLPGLKVLETH